MKIGLPNKYTSQLSNVLVIDLGKNESDYKVGDLVEFTMDYMGTLRVLNSRYVEKIIHDKQNHLLEKID